LGPRRGVARPRAKRFGLKILDFSERSSCVVEGVFARVEVCVDILLYGYRYLPFVFLLASLRSLSWAALSASS